ncbi:hypothetical protein ACJX0J_022533, partial [Zea mays]
EDGEDPLNSDVFIGGERPNFVENFVKGAHVIFGREEKTAASLHYENSIHMYPVNPFVSKPFFRMAISFLDIWQRDIDWLEKRGAQILQSSIPESLAMSLLPIIFKPENGRFGEWAEVAGKMFNILRGPPKQNGSGTRKKERRLKDFLSMSLEIDIHDYFGIIICISIYAHVIIAYIGSMANQII